MSNFSLRCRTFAVPSARSSTFTLFATASASTSANPAAALNLSGKRDATSTTARRGFSWPHIAREVDPLGHKARLGPSAMREMTPKDLATHKQLVDAGLKGKSVLLTGVTGTGKRTVAFHIGRALQNSGKTVAWTSLKSDRVISLGAIHLLSYLGLRFGTELPTVEQIIASLERHVRLMETTFEHVFPSLTNTDVLVVDSLELAPPRLLEAIDAVAKDVRGSTLPFGGIQIIAVADFWRMEAHPGSPLHGYVFQDPRFAQEWFPRPQQFLFQTIHAHQGNAAFTKLTHDALLGNLTTAKIKELEGMCATLPEVSGFPASPVVTMKLTLPYWFPKFPKQLASLTPPPKAAALRLSEFGTYLLMSVGIGNSPRSLCLPERLSVDVGSKVHVTIADDRVPAGALGIVTVVDPHRVTVYFPELGHAETICRLKVTQFFPDYPDLAFSVAQFPLYPREAISSERMLPFGQIRHFELDARYLTNTNDLGNILASAVGGPSALRIVPDTVAAFLRRDGMTHEPVRVFYEDLAGAIDTTGMRWCKNCKTHVPSAEFVKHWSQCVESVRWCTDCNCTIDAAKWEPHCEKHTVVMCLDCGAALEWRHWEFHRLSCAPMLRELTPENVLLPSATRDNAMNLGFDKKDLHTIKSITKSQLPRTHTKLTGRAGTL